VRFPGLFRIGAWLLIAAGGWYLVLGARGANDGSTTWAPLAIVGAVALAVGTSLLLWFRRSGPP
jgi:hypothetical protein